MDGGVVGAPVGNALGKCDEKSLESLPKRLGCQGARRKRSKKGRLATPARILSMRVFRESRHSKALAQTVLRNKLGAKKKKMRSRVAFVFGVWTCEWPRSSQSGFVTGISTSCSIDLPRERKSKESMKASVEGRETTRVRQILLFFSKTLRYFSDGDDAKAG